MITENELVEYIGRTTPPGLAIVFLANVLCFVIGSYIVKGQSPVSSVSTLTIILGIVGITDIGAAFIVKRNMLKPLFELKVSADNNQILPTIRKTTITISAICAAPPIYGLIAVFMGAQREHLAAFGIISLGGYMALRLRPRDFEKLIEGSS
jgi:hypothetical protein